jgi:ATP-dependent protease HslVU (ClpYQ) peptidase subunit
MLQIVRYHINVMPPREGQDLMEWMVVDFAEAVRQAMKDYGFALIDRNREEGGYFLIGFRGHLFAVEKDFNVMELDDHLMAIGSGREYALGAMIALQDLPPEKRIYKALGIAGHWCTSVRGPYHVISEAA